MLSLRTKTTLTHLFVSCPFVKSFWTEFTNWWNTKNDDSIELNEENIIYGFTNNIALQLGLNLSLIIAFTLPREKKTLISLIPSLLF